MFLFVGAGLFAMFLFLTYYFQVNLGYTPLKAGFAFLPFSLGIILAAGVVSQLLPRVGPRALMLPGLAMAVVGHAAADPDRPGHVVLGARVPRDGRSCRSAWPASSSRRPAPRSSASSSHDAGVASAVLNTSQQIGGSLGTALLNTLFAGAVTAYLTDNPPTSPGQAQRPLPLAFIHGYHVAFFWGAVLFACALVATFVLINAHKEDVPRTPR